LEATHGTAAPRPRQAVRVAGRRAAT
jgi:hypothetical protein